MLFLLWMMTYEAELTSCSKLSWLWNRKSSLRPCSHTLFLHLQADFKSTKNHIKCKSDPNYPTSFLHTVRMLKVSAASLSTWHTMMTSDREWSASEQRSRFSAAPKSRLISCRKECRPSVLKIWDTNLTSVPDSLISAKTSSVVNLYRAADWTGGSHVNTW